MLQLSGVYLALCVGACAANNVLVELPAKGEKWQDGQNINIRFVKNYDLLSYKISIFPVQKITVV